MRVGPEAAGLVVDPEAVVDSAVAVAAGVDSVAEDVADLAEVADSVEAGDAVAASVVSADRTPMHGHGTVTYTGSDSDLNATQRIFTGTSLAKPTSDRNSLTASVPG